jgi:hypothetical protein
MIQSMIQGFAWFVRPDVRHQPFETLPRPAYLWPLDGEQPGVHNQHGPAAYLVVTETAEPPAVEPGWQVEPALLDADFSAPGVRLIRLANNHMVGSKTVREYVFEVAGG